MVDGGGCMQCVFRAAHIGEHRNPQMVDGGGVHAMRVVLHTQVNIATHRWSSNGGWGRGACNACSVLHTSVDGGDSRTHAHLISS
jgi:hypothetical protein